MSDWYEDGLRFSCSQCGNCCTGPPGAVWFTDNEGQGDGRRNSISRWMIFTSDMHEKLAEMVINRESQSKESTIASFSIGNHRETKLPTLRCSSLSSVVHGHFGQKTSVQKPVGSEPKAKRHAQVWIRANLFRQAKFASIATPNKLPQSQIHFQQSLGSGPCAKLRFDFVDQTFENRAERI